ncbi:MAG TPA: c-type cytochrome [Bryobacteraceae bacterium]|nr:c-type cytochrome [Bryobacteraceae bacterium]
MRNRLQSFAIAVISGAAMLGSGTAPAVAQGRGGGGGRATATFPAQQRAPGDPVEIAHGKTLYDVDCQKCHGADLRGNLEGGTSLLRSGIALSDQHGELIAPVIAGSMKASGMPAINMTPDDVKAVAEYIHSVLATEKTQGSPPAPGVPAPSALVGNAAAGKIYFDAHCASCHSPTGDLQGFADKYPDAKEAQNRWVSGGGGGRGRTIPGAAPDARTVMVTVTEPSGEKVEGPLVQLDDFLVSLTMPDGTIRTFSRNGDVPKVEVKDPMQAHKNLLDTLKNKDMHDVTAYLETLK